MRSYENVEALDAMNTVLQLEPMNAGLSVCIILSRRLFSFSLPTMTCVESTEAFLQKAEILDRLGETEQAVEQCNLSLRYRPDFGLTVFNRAALFKKMGREQLALNDLSASFFCFLLVRS